jgi:predicted small lipoprotein YifL
MMKKALLMTASIAALLTLTGCAVRGPTVWVEPPVYYGPAVIVEPRPTVVVVEERHYYQDRHYHKKHKKHKRHYHHDD